MKRTWARSVARPARPQEGHKESRPRKPRQKSPQAKQGSRPRRGRPREEERRPWEWYVVPVYEDSVVTTRNGEKMVAVRKVAEHAAVRVELLEEEERREVRDPLPGMGYSLRRAVEAGLVNFDGLVASVAASSPSLVSTPSARAGFAHAVSAAAREATSAQRGDGSRSFSARAFGDALSRELPSVDLPACMRRNVRSGVLEPRRPRTPAPKEERPQAHVGFYTAPEAEAEDEIGEER